MDEQLLLDRDYATRLCRSDAILGSGCSIMSLENVECTTYVHTYFLEHLHVQSINQVTVVMTS